MVDAAVTQRFRDAVVAIASRGSWLLPLAGLTVVGLSDSGGALRALTSDARIAIAVVSAVPGLALGAGAWLGSVAGDASRRSAIVGAAVSAAVLLVAGVGTISGAISGERARTELAAAADSAVRDYPGWNGGTLIDGASVYAIEVDARSDLARILLRPYDQPLRVVLLGVDNRAGHREVVLDVEGARAVRGGAIGAPQMVPSLTRAERLAHANPDQERVVQDQLAPVTIPAGTQSDVAFALFAPSTSFQDVSAIEVRVNGEMATLHGQYFTLERKRAIDHARGK
jgi:hypothetical protein